MVMSRLFLKKLEQICFTKIDCLCSLLIYLNNCIQVKIKVNSLDWDFDMRLKTCLN